MPQGNRTAWVSTDELFTIGNGTGPGASEQSNAFVVRKNGDTAIGGSLKVAGAVRIAPQGDLAMGEFTHEPQ